MPVPGIAAQARRLLAYHLRTTLSVATCNVRSHLPCAPRPGSASSRIRRIRTATYGRYGEIASAQYAK
eukprot:1908739-Rhodomonas_salina.2